MGRIDINQRFDAKWQYTPGCWVWTASRLKGGYGKFTVNRIDTTAHRTAYARWHGPIPTGMHVLHSCDNPACVNPDHLFLGTHVENMTDRDRKQRAARQRGQTNGMAKVSDAARAHIQSLYAGGQHTQSCLGVMYGLHQSTVSDIVHRG